LRRRKLNIENDLQIRKICSEDIDILLGIENESHPDPWSRKMFEKELKLDYAYFFVGNILSEIVTYIGFWHIMDEAHLTNITVSKNYRRLGIGKKMMEYLTNCSKMLKIKRILLEVRENNLPAISLYKKFDFKKIHIRKKYYSNYENAVIMEKLL